MPNRFDNPSGTATLGREAESFYEIISQVERLHRLILDGLKNELTARGIHSINAVQAMFVYNIGIDEVSSGDLKRKFFYQGANVSYNLQKLSEAGFLTSERDLFDQRVLRIQLTEEGLKIHHLVGQYLQTIFEEITSTDRWSSIEILFVCEKLATLESTLQQIPRAND